MSRGVKREYTDEDLRAAVQSAHSWRGVMGELGYITRSGRVATRVRLRAEELGLDTGHFRGQRTWSAAQLESAIQESTSWPEVVGRLGLSSVNSDIIARVRSYAARMGIEPRHFTTYRDRSAAMPFTASKDDRYLRRAATSMAMTWFLHRGYGVSLPTEPQPYDLIVQAAGVLYRIQVKTATARDPKSGHLYSSIARQPLRDGKKVPYDPEDVDFFFIVSADGCQYVVPVAEVGGTMSVQLTTVAHRKVA